MVRHLQTKGRDMNLAAMWGIDAKMIEAGQAVAAEWLTAIKAHTEALNRNTLVSESLAEAIVKSGEEGKVSDNGEA